MSTLKPNNEFSPRIPSAMTYMVQRIDGADAYMLMLLSLSDRAVSKAEHFLRETMPKYKSIYRGEVKRFSKMVYNQDAPNYFDKGSIHRFYKSRNEQMIDDDFEILANCCYAIEQHSKNEEKQLIYAVTKEMNSKNVKHAEFFVEINMVLCNLLYFKETCQEIYKTHKYALALNPESPNVREEMFAITPTMLDSIYMPLSSIYNLLVKKEQFSLSGKEIVRSARALYDKITCIDNIREAVEDLGYRIIDEKQLYEEQKAIADRDKSGDDSGREETNR